MTVIPISAGKMSVGIDLGARYARISIVEDRHPVIIPNRLGEPRTPIAISVDDDGAVLVGTPARARAGTHPEATTCELRRDLGTERLSTLGRRTFRAPELAALVLRSLREDAEAALDRRVDEAIITVPPWFDEPQREATREAAALAGLAAVQLLNEPTAAALAYGLDQRHRTVRAAVLALGDGAFETAILEVGAGAIALRAAAVDARLGGDDFVDALAELVIRRRGLSLDPIARERLRAGCRRAERQLSAEDVARVTVPELPVGSRRGLDEPISRAEAEAAWSPLLERLGAPILRALRVAERQAGDLDEVLLVGGATRIPCVFALAARLFGRMPLRTLPPDEVVALGAAVHAASATRVADRVVADLAPATVGIAVGDGRTNGRFVPVIERGTVLPATRLQTFNTTDDDQQRLELELFQGEHPLRRDNRALGSFLVGELPPRLAGHVLVDVRFSLGRDLLLAEATVRETGRKTTAIFERAPGRLSPAALLAARADLTRLESHPRDALPNATALARAEAVAAALTGPPRERLAQALAAFRTALDREDPLLIERAREALASATTALAPPA